MSILMPFPPSPVYSNLFHRTADVSLHFIVVGGSVGGLSAAYNLLQAGHTVHVLEKSSGFENVRTRSCLLRESSKKPNRSQAGGGVRVPPNMTKLLLHWGLEDIVMRTGVKCPRIDFLEGAWHPFQSCRCQSFHRCISHCRHEWRHFEFVALSRGAHEGAPSRNDWHCCETRSISIRHLIVD